MDRLRARSAPAWGAVLALLMWPAAEAPFRPAAAGAWLPGKGETLLIADMTVAEADQAYTGGSDRQDTVDFNKKELQLYAEHGASREVTLIGKMAWRREEYDDPADKIVESGLRFAEGGARMTLGMIRETRVTLEFLTALHLEGDRGETAVSEPGDADFEAALFLGQSGSFWGIDFFTDQRMGYRFRPTGGRPNEINAIFTTGLKPDDEWMVLLQSSNYIADGQSSAEAYKGHVSVVKRLNHILSVELGGYATYAGRNTVKENGLKLGFWYRF